ncbi:MAG: N-acetyl-gamma-glutamyl-phosphate reductase [Pseudobdellovibrio sp.]
MHKETADIFTKKNLISCSVVGARGYSGLELTRILMQHPSVKLTHCFATAKFKLTDYVSNPKAKDIVCLPDSEIMQNLTDVVFLATPAEVSLKLAPQILAAGKKVIDLSGAFRLKKNDYKKWYGFEHTETGLLEQAHYGLVNWAKPSAGENLVANPGCYATATALAIIPLLKSNIIFQDSIVIDAKSGATGAGKKATENLLFTEVTEDCIPYKVGRHQHYPEIIETIEAVTGQLIEAHFTTSLIAVRRGIIAGVYAKLKPQITKQDVASCFTSAYSEQALISFGDLCENSNLASLRKVVGTAKTHITFEVVDNKLYVFSCIDNLLKGAASQAIENLNRLCDLPTHTGLTHLEATT